MGALYDRVGMTVSGTPGTGTITLLAAVTDATNGDMLTFADAGVANATVVNYLIVDGNNFELGTGTYTSSGTTLSRGATLSKTGGTKGTTAISATSAAKVYIVPQAAAANTWAGALALVDAVLLRDAANTLALKNSTNAQTFRVYGSSDGSGNDAYAQFQHSTAGALTISAQKTGTQTAGSINFTASGQTNSLRIGTSVDTANNLIVGGSLGLGNGVQGTGGAFIASPSASVIKLWNSAFNDAPRLNFGGDTSSFPALKRSTTVLQVRLADDSAFASVQGKITADNAYTATPPTCTGYITMYDSTGTAYKVMVST
jgi:hypothetical protein